MFEFVTLSPTHDKKQDEDDEYDPLALDDNEVKKEEQLEDDITILPHSKEPPAQMTQARILTFDKQINILADPGWDGISDLSYLEPIIPKVDLIILSQTTVDYLGAFALLLYKYPILRRVKIYSTLPIAKLGRLSTIELYRARGLIGPLENAVMEADDIEKFFNSIIPLNYAQSVPLQGNLSGITITAYNSGHTLGGAIWLLNREGEKIVYAPSWNHSKDTFLQNSKLSLHNLLRPTTLISGSDLGSGMAHKKRVEQFLNLAQLTLNNNTTLFLPTSVTGRLFELVLLLERSIDRNIPFYMISFTGIKPLQFSSNMLEWMSPDITKNWETQNQSPFESTRLQLITIDELDLLDQGPKVVFVENLDMCEGSLGRTALASLCTRHHTAVMMTERPHLNSTFYELYESWENLASGDNRLHEGSLVLLNKHLTITVHSENALHGKDLNSYLKRVEERRAEQKEIELEQQRNDNLLDEIIDEDENDEDEDGLNLGLVDEDKILRTGENGKSLIIQPTHDSAKDEDENTVSMADILKMPMDFDVRDAKGKNRMFPFIVKKVAVDDYGTIIKHDDFMREEERFMLKTGTEAADGNGVGEDSDYGDESDDHESAQVGGKRKRRGKRGGRKRRKRRDRKPQGESGLQDERKSLPTLFNMDPTADPVSVKNTTSIFTAKCGITFVDLSGLADLRSMKITFNNLKPRKVILLPNTSHSKYLGDSNSIMESLAKQQREKLIGNTFHEQHSNGILGTDYMVSQPNEAIDLGNVITSYDLQIEEELDQELKWQEITGGYSIAHVVGEVNKVQEANSGTRNVFKLHGVAKNKAAGLMEIANTASKKLSIGDIKLNDLRAQLSRLNLRVEFKGDGALVVNGHVAVRKVSDGHLIVDGNAGPLFYQVRDVVNSMLAYV